MSITRQLSKTRLFTEAYELEQLVTEMKKIDQIMD
jgi:hypothetical protein